MPALPPTDPPPQTDRPPAEGGEGFVLEGRYRAARLVKRGNGVETFFGTDDATGQPVVIKTTEARRVSASVRIRLEHEALVLRQLRSPWVAPLLSFGTHDDQFYLVMAFVPGTPLQERLRDGPLSIAEAVALGQRLFAVLRDVHDQGVLHRDLKPANIIVSGQGGAIQPSLIDFGLSQSDWLDAAIRDQPVGTARYLSPEQAGLLGDRPDNRSDLYSAGAVLFECVAGRPPFEGDNVGELLWQHMTAAPPPLRSLRGDAPRALDEVIQRLLRKDPRDRYQSAEGALADLGRIAEGLARGEADVPLVVGLHDRRRALTEPAFVGRARELAALEEQVARAREGKGGVVLLEAESGGGKTRLLAELSRQAGTSGAWVLHGQGLDQAAQRPFQVLAGVATGILSEEQRAPGVGARLRAALREQVGAVCAAMPELREVLGAGEAEQGPESFGHVRVQEALAALLDALGAEDRPALVLLDDCQWACGLTLQLLRRWQARSREGEAPAEPRAVTPTGPAPPSREDRPGSAGASPSRPDASPSRPDASPSRPAVAGRHVLLVVAFRTEDVGPDHALRQLQPARRLALGRFDRKATEELVKSMAGPLPGEAVDVIERLSEGSPFMAAAALQGLVEAGALVASPAGGWAIDPLALADVQSPRHVASFLVRRIERLPAAVVTLLSAAAVLGKEFDFQAAAALVGQGAAAAHEAVEEARRRQLVWSAGQGAPYAFLHDKLRQTFLQRLPDDERRDLHRRAALDLEARAPHRIFDLAYHFDAAGQSARALPYALAAAEQARARHSLEVAEQQYRIALRGAAAGDRPARFRAARGLGEVLMLRGRYAEAAPELRAALDLADDPFDRAQVEGKLGELAFKQDDLPTAGEHLERALGLLGRHAPRWRATFLLLAGWESLVQLTHTLFPRGLLARRKLEGERGRRDMLAVRLYSRLAHLYWFHKGTVPVLWAHLRGLNLAERYPPTPELAQAYSEHAPGISLLGWFGRGLSYAKKSLAIRQALNDLWGQGQSLHYQGVVHYAASRYPEAIASCREAIRLLARTGDQWEMSIARFQVAASLYHLGQLKEAVEEAQRMYQTGLDIGDAQASGISLDVWARAARGRVPAELIAAELARPSVDIQRAAQVMLAQAVRLLYRGQPGEAATVLQEALARLDRAGVMNAWTTPVLPWLATALREQAELLRDRLPGRRAELLRQAAAAARRGHRLARTFRNELPHAQRELGLLAALRGATARALRYFDESLAVARQHGARYEEARTRLARAELARELGQAGAEQELADANRELVRLEDGLAEPAEADERPSAVRGATLGLIDRFDTLLETGRHIASALSREAVFAAAREAALKLLRGERCEILKVGPEAGPAAALSGEVAPQFSQEMVRQALAGGKAVVFLDTGAQESSESLLLSGARSVLCAPIQVRGQPVGCFYVTHRQVSGLFGEAERRLADFVATLTGAALENAEGFAELRRLNVALEQGIAELREAQGRIQEQAALLDKAQDAIMVLDFEDRILYWNRSAERLYGWRADEVQARSMQQLLGGGAAHQAAAAAVRGAGEWAGELRQQTREGAEVFVESRWTLVRDDQGTPRSLLVVSTDVTEKRQLEAHLLRTQRTESIGQLAGGIAHDINNVLTPIILASQLLRVDPGTPEDRNEILANIEEVALRGADMVKQILTYARGMEGNRVDVQLKHLIGEVRRVVAHTFPKSIQVDVPPPRDLWVVHADATQLHQMLMNLCVNARDAMPEGGTLRVTAENVTLGEADLRDSPEARPGPYVKLTVADTGTGIPPEVLDRMFDPFFTTKEYGKGTGLGLATVQGILKGHGGFLRVATRVGQGTQMAIYLPATEAVSPSAKVTVAAELPGGAQETVLVVDDEAHVRDITTRHLQAFGYRALAARGGQEAVEMYGAHAGEVRLVLTDIMMPGMDGRALIRALRELAPRLPVVVMSGLPVDVPIGEGPLGVSAVLQKPFKTEELLITVKEAIRAER